MLLVVKDVKVRPNSGFPQDYIHRKDLTLCHSAPVFIRVFHFVCASLNEKNVVHPE